MTDTGYRHSRPQQAWAHRGGRINLGPLAGSDWGPAALSVRAQIADAFFRFGMAWDEARVDVLCSCFTADGVLEAAEGQAVSQRSLPGRQAIHAHVTKTLNIQNDQRRHLVSNVVVEHLDLSAGTARALAQSVVTATGERLELAASVIYEADVVCDDDGCWRFRRLFIGMDRYLERS